MSTSFLPLVEKIIIGINSNSASNRIFSGDYPNNFLRFIWHLSKDTFSTSETGANGAIRHIFWLKTI